LSRTLLIATWGNPSRWGCADYVCGSVSVRTCTSLPALQQVLRGDVTTYVMPWIASWIRMRRSLVLARVAPVIQAVGRRWGR